MGESGIYGVIHLDLFKLCTHWQGFTKRQAVRSEHRRLSSSWMGGPAPPALALHSPSTHSALGCWSLGAICVDPARRACSSGVLMSVRTAPKCFWLRLGAAGPEHRQAGPGSSSCWACCWLYLRTGRERASGSHLAPPGEDQWRAGCGCVLGPGAPLLHVLEQLCAHRAWAMSTPLLPPHGSGWRRV